MTDYISGMRQRGATSSHDHIYALIIKLHACWMRDRPLRTEPFQHFLCSVPIPHSPKFSLLDDEGGILDLPSSSRQKYRLQVSPLTLQQNKPKQAFIIFFKRRYTTLSTTVHAYARMHAYRITKHTCRDQSRVERLPGLFLCAPTSAVVQKKALQ